ncbi:MAG: T9SS type A sorting domain-containing protein [Bacteroidota bacterium]
MSVPESPRSLPSGFALLQNYPNPFNPTTEIRYQIPEVSHVALKVYDLLGREVATMADDVEEPGYKSVQLNASQLASGVYFYRLQFGRFVETRKMLVVK